MSDPTWDPRLVSRVSQLSVLARQLVEERPSVIIGRSCLPEISDLRHIRNTLQGTRYALLTGEWLPAQTDWLCGSRTEADVPIWIVVDSSADLGTDGSPSPDLNQPSLVSFWLWPQPSLICVIEEGEESWAAHYGRAAQWHTSKQAIASIQSFAPCRAETQGSSQYRTLTGAIFQLDCPAAHCYCAV